MSLLEGPVDNLKTRAKGYQYDHVDLLTVDPTRTWRKMHELRNIYLQGGYIAEGVDLYPTFTLGSGYTLESKDDRAKEEIQTFLTKINFYDITWQLMVDAEVVRDGVAEIVFGAGQLAKTPVNLVVRPAECFEFETDGKGVIETYEQRNDNLGNALTPTVKLEPSSVLHYQFLSRPDSPYGISIVERTVHDIKRDTQVAEAVVNGILLHGTPKWHIKANSTKPDPQPLSDDEWSGLETEFKDFNSKDQFMTEGDIVIESKDIQGLPNVQQYSDVSLARVVSGLGVPGELLGLRQGTTDATAVSRIDTFFKKIKIIQNDIEQLWNTGIIDRVTGTPGLVKLKLNPANPPDFTKLAEGLSKIRSGVDPDAVIDANEARGRLGLPAREESAS